MGPSTDITDVLEERIITAKEFMQLIGIKSRTTFDKYVKNGTVPPPMEWPPGTVQRGWRLSVAVDHVNKMIAEASEKGWPDLTHDINVD